MLSKKCLQESSRKAPGPATIRSHAYKILATLVTRIAFGHKFFFTQNYNNLEIQTIRNIFFIYQVGKTFKKRRG